MASAYTKSETTPDPAAKRGLMYVLTYSVIASFQARAATSPREVVIRVTVWVATFW